jgi:UDP-2-acetamido-2-deoxy-ribo-hexuluronate aminotransferase
MITNIAGDRLYQQIGERLNDAHMVIHKSGNWIDGDHCRSVEKKLKFITGRKHAKMLNSATSGLMVALLSWNIRNKNVACVNYSYIASANQAALLNDVELFDVDTNGLMQLDETFNHDLVIPVSLYGNTIDYDGLKVGSNTKVIVDAAQSLGARYKGKPDGSFGDAAVFSFARNKPIPTAGTHGALVWDDDDMCEIIKAVSNNGKSGRLSKIKNFGINAIPMELQAAQIDIGLDHMGEWQVKRKQVHQHYTDSFTNLPLRIIQPSEHCESNYHKFALLTDNRDGLKSFLHEKGIQAIEHYTDNFAEFIGSDKSFPNTEMFCEQVLTLPNHPWLTDAEVEIVADAVKDFYK